MNRKKLNRARQGISVKMLVAALAIVVGAILGPLYGFYCVEFSGKQSQSHEITVGQPLSISLSPEMNPVRFNASIEYEMASSMAITAKATYYSATLNDGESEVWSNRFGVRETPDDDEETTGVTISFDGIKKAHSSASIRSFDVDSAKEYSFLVSPTKTNDLKVNKITLKVRENVRQVNIPIVIVGSIMLLIGIFTVLFSVVFAKPN